MISSMEILELLSSYKSDVIQVDAETHFEIETQNKMYNTSDHSLVEAKYCALCSQAHVQMYTEFL